MTSSVDGAVNRFATSGTGSSAVLHVWYDKEYGSKDQVPRVVGAMADARRPARPPATTGR